MDGRRVLLHHKKAIKTVVLCAGASYAVMRQLAYFAFYGAFAGLLGFSRVFYRPWDEMRVTKQNWRSSLKVLDRGKKKAVNLSAAASGFCGVFQ